jgi:hypothetical protein
LFIAKLEKLVQLCEPVIGAAVWHVIPDRVADLLEGEQLAHNRQLEWPVVVLNHNQINTLSNTIKLIHCQSQPQSNTLSMFFEIKSND